MKVTLRVRDYPYKGRYPERNYRKQMDAEKGMLAEIFSTFFYLSPVSIEEGPEFSWEMIITFPGNEIGADDFTWLWMHDHDMKVEGFKNDVPVLPDTKAYFCFIRDEANFGSTVSQR